MSLISSRARVTTPGAHAARVAPRRASRRQVGAALLAGALLIVAGCGMEVQTNQPYTPGEGVNIDVAGSGNINEVVHVRNLGIISHGPGEGILSGSLIGNGPDAMTEVSGTAIKIDGSDGSPITAELTSPVEVGDETLVVLTNLSPLITFDSADLAPGLTANLTLTFRTAGEVTIRVPVLNGEAPQYKSITPSPSASGSSESASPSPSPSE